MFKGNTFLFNLLFIIIIIDEDIRSSNRMSENRLKNIPLSVENIKMFEIR
jgi:hypothetical protein